MSEFSADDFKKWLKYSISNSCSVFYTIANEVGYDNPDKICRAWEAYKNWALKL